MSEIFPETPAEPAPDLPAAPAVAAPAPEQDPGGEIGRVAAELSRLRADAIAGAKAILRVLPPHSSMTYGGWTVTDEPTTVPLAAVPGLYEAAQNAGVNLIQEA